MIPACVELLAFDFSFLSLIPSEKIECQSTDGSRILGSVSRSGSALVFPESPI